MTVHLAKVLFKLYLVVYCLDDPKMASRCIRTVLILQGLGKERKYSSVPFSLYSVKLGSLTNAENLVNLWRKATYACQHHQELA
ncbi:hypothetical protein L6452_20876 [Arctium lappa]|uniref:Uncharacterized protein n=1 Tax=Arctium lappa TaxID=4217 RepID=A0ACB9BDE1_ARCLA|nr:hypothetical protein L6452_20876 [Arctium lappa]